MILPSGNDDTKRLMDYFRANSPGRAELGPGRFLVTGLRLEGLSCSIVGCDDATVIAAIAEQDQPVLDFTGYSYPAGACGIRTIGGFAVEGDGLPVYPGPGNPTVADKTGIRLGVYGKFYCGISGMHFRDIAISKTGGPCLDVCASQLSSFDHVILNTPVGCVANDVPYIQGCGACNGNSFRRIGLRSMTRGNDCPRGGAARFVETDAVPHTPSGNQFSDWWFEYLHPGTDSALFVLQGSNNTIRDFQYFDTTKEPGATGTAAFRVLQPSVGKEDYRGNLIEGFIFGSLQPGLDCGVDMGQPENAIVGVKGKSGSNVILREAAKNTSITFRGSQQDAGSFPAVVDSQGRATVLDGSVTIHDHPGGYYYLGGRQTGATVDLGDDRRWTPQGLFNGRDRQWTDDGLRPEGFIKWPGSGGLGPGPDESLRYVGWSQDARGNRRQGFVVPPLKGKDK